MKMEPDCPFNAMLDCPPGEAHNCKKCGWNPKVAEERLETLRKAAKKSAGSGRVTRKKKEESE